MSVEAPVRDFMSPHPLTLPRTASVAEASRALVENRISILPITEDDGTVAGVVSATDLARLPRGDTRLVSELMVQRVATAAESEPVAAAAAHLVASGVQHLIVVDPEGRPRGVLSSLDVARAVAELPATQPISWIMTEELAAIDIGASVEEARAVLEDAGYSAAPVVDGGVVVGFVSRLDLLDPDVDGGDRVDVIMQTNVRTVEPDMAVRDAARLLAEEGLKRLFVTDEAGELVGVLTVTDVAGFAASYLEDTQG